jgi:excisionase family DNA binding protein
MEALTVSPKQAAQSLGIGLTKLYELINEGRIETLKLDNRRLVKVDSIRALVKAA